jgi:hypothetical protein
MVAVQRRGKVSQQVDAVPVVLLNHKLDELQRAKKESKACGWLLAESWCMVDWQLLGRNKVGCHKQSKPNVNCIGRRDLGASDGLARAPFHCHTFT